jgi:hypothetical protein
MSYGTFTLQAELSVSSSQCLVLGRGKAYLDITPDSRIVCLLHQRLLKHDVDIANAVVTAVDVVVDHRRRCH